MELRDILSVGVLLDTVHITELGIAHIFVLEYVVQSALVPSILDAPVKLGGHSFGLLFFIGVTVGVVRAVLTEFTLMALKLFP